MNNFKSYPLATARFARIFAAIGLTLPLVSLEKAVADEPLPPTPTWVRAIQANPVAFSAFWFVHSMRRACRQVQSS